MTLVTLSGIDGSGKTTLAYNLVGSLKSFGWDAVYCYGRFVPRYLSVLPVLFRRLRFGHAELEGFPREYAHHRSVFVENPVVNTVYGLMIALTYAGELGAELHSLMNRHDVVVCDRYVLDTWVLDMRLCRTRSPVRDFRSLRLLSGFLQMPSHSYLIDVSAEIALQRRQNNYPAPILERAIRDYRLGAHYLHARVLDGSRPLDENVQYILRGLNVS